jgi:hypothetical protein
VKSIFRLARDTAFSVWTVVRAALSLPMGPDMAFQGGWLDFSLISKETLCKYTNSKRKFLLRRSPAEIQYSGTLVGVLEIDERVSGQFREFEMNTTDVVSEGNNPSNRSDSQNEAVGRNGSSWWLAAPPPQWGLLFSTPGLATRILAT